MFHILSILRDWVAEKNTNLRLSSSGDSKKITAVLIFFLLLRCFLCFSLFQSPTCLRKGQALQRRLVLNFGFETIEKDILQMDDSKDNLFKPRSIFKRSCPKLIYDVEILVFGVHENQLLLCEVHEIDRIMLVTFSDRRNSENGWTGWLECFNKAYLAS